MGGGAARRSYGVDAMAGILGVRVPVETASAILRLRMASVWPLRTRRRMRRSFSALKGLTRKLTSLRPTSSSKRSLFMRPLMAMKRRAGSLALRFLMVVAPSMTGIIMSMRTTLILPGFWAATARASAPSAAVRTL